MKKLLSFIPITVVLISCQPLSINGRVLDEEMAPVAGSTILLTRSDTTVVTDKYGQFTLSPVRIHDTIMVSAPGFRSTKKVLNFIGGNSMTVILKKKE